MTYPAFWIHKFKVVNITCCTEVSVDLQHKFQVEVLPVICWVNVVGIYSFPWLILCARHIQTKRFSKNLLLTHREYKTKRSSQMWMIFMGTFPIPLHTDRYRLCLSYFPHRQTFCHFQRLASNLTALEIMQAHDTPTETFDSFFFFKLKVSGGISIHHPFLLITELSRPS